MKNTKLTACIKPGQVFTAADLINGPWKNLNFNTANARLSRLVKAGTLKRIQKGLYAMPIQTVFGEIMPNSHDIVTKTYIDDGNGYASGPTFMSQIGLSTWIPQKTYIKSNKKNSKNTQPENFDIHMPRTKITQKNKKYLQLLDCIEDLSRKKYAADCSDPDSLIRKYIDRENIDKTRLLLTAHKHYGKPVQEHLYDILEDEYEIT